MPRRLDTQAWWGESCGSESFPRVVVFLYIHNGDGDTHPAGARARGGHGGNTSLIPSGGRQSSLQNRVWPCSGPKNARPRGRAARAARAASPPPRRAGNATRILITNARKNQAEGQETAGVMVQVEFYSSGSSRVRSDAGV